MRRQLLPPARRRIKVIVNDRITAYIQSLDAGNGPLLDSIEEEALADCVPIIRRETSAFLKTLIALKRPQSILEVGTAVGYSALLMRYRGIPLCGRAPQPDDPHADARLFI